MADMPRHTVWVQVSLHPSLNRPLPSLVIRVQGLHGNAAKAACV